MALSEFKVPRDQRYFEDYELGAVYEFGPVVVDEEELIGFARRYDPQMIHTDRALAAEGPFKGLIASGWHTMAMMMRLMVDHFVSTVAAIASPGVDELRWMQPVRPGDSLRLRVTIIEARRSQSKPDRGLVRSLGEVINQDGAVVSSFKGMSLFRLRDPSA